jgi:hypothetical protein
VRKSLAAVAAAIASAGLIAAPDASAQPPECGPNPDMTTAYVDTGFSSHNDGVWVACVRYQDVNHQCFASFGKYTKLYRRGEGPAPECRSIYNSH